MSVKLSKTTLTLGVGVTDSSVTASIEPTGANQEMTVTSADVKIATATLISGKLEIKGIAAGIVKVNITSKSKPTVKAELSVTVETTK
ncbi:Ig-like domain-containing protein [Dellaglioa sp. BT-FLS60]